MIKYTIATSLMIAALPQFVLAQSKQPVDVGGYCEVVEKQIVALANTSAKANDDLARFASDMPTADPTKFAKANALLTSLSGSLRDKELEWYHLGCSQILYRRPASD